MSVARIEPDIFTKGDSVSWRKSLACYPASEWTLTYYIRGINHLDVTATADGDVHVISIDTASSNSLTPGDYWWQAKATKGAEVITVASGQFIVKPSLTDVSAGHDGRSHTKITLDNLYAVIEKRATLDQQSYAINGRSLSRMSIDELLTFKEKYERLYQRELRQLGIKKGLGTGRKIHTRFND